MSEGNATIVPFTRPVAHPMHGCPCKYVSNDDHLVMDVWCSVASVVVEFTGLLLTTEGAYIPFQQTVSPTSDRAITTGTLKLTEGFLLHLQARVSSGTVRRGQCFVKAALQRGAISNAMRHTTLLSNYVSLNDEVTYPGSTMQSSVEGPGIILSVTGTNPAAGSELSDAVPTNARRLLLMGQATLVTDATASNRNVRWLITDGTTEVFRSYPGGNQTASQTALHSVGPGIGGQTITNLSDVSQIPVLPLLFAGYTIQTNTNNLQAGDNWGAPTYIFEEWIEE